MERAYSISPPSGQHGPEPDAGASGIIQCARVVSQIGGLSGEWIVISIVPQVGTVRADGEPRFPHTIRLLRTVAMSIARRSGRAATSAKALGSTFIYTTR